MQLPCISTLSPTVTRRPLSCCGKVSAKTVKSKNAPSLTSPKQPGAKIADLRRVLKNEPLVGRDDVFHIVRSLPHGHVAAVLGTLRKLRLDLLINPEPSPQRERVPAMIAARILNPGSKLAAARGLAEATAHDTLAETPGLEPLDENDLYASMDRLLARQERIERGLAKQHLETGALALYDLTSVWMEGRFCPLARLGHSRDGKRNKLRIEFGLLCNQEGCPVSAEVFAGNTADPSTVGAQVKKLREQFNLSTVVPAGDRGMLTEARIREDIKPAELDWIGALRGSAIRSLVDNGTVQLSLFDEKDPAEVKSDACPGERLMVCRNPLSAEQRAHKREALLDAAAGFARTDCDSNPTPAAASDRKGANRRTGRQGHRPLQGN